MKKTLKLWRYRLRMAWYALRGDFDDYGMPLDDTWELTDEAYSILDDIPFVETTEPIKFRTTLPPQAWRKLKEGEPL
jgi:hypothetical protein